ncbi:flavodoxin domain-containing protein [Candidatus Soleaferrea massiliensis]|uniref:flavodoxin domain-containing protein n=1 Tax=Candidatus Soleaferrea massiliensis TaxID=1470354 RepID=UPI000590D53A|nr:flavodoxin domain-containing protein [Candidatus Soleaferrea massiliensis]
MNKTAVVYTSRYGYTEQYAKWIAEALGADLFTAKGLHGEKLADYDTIIAGGGIYAGTIGSAKWLCQNAQKFDGKNMIFFTVGLSPTHDPSAFAPCLEHSLPEELRKKLHIFHFRGGIDYPKLGFLHRSMMSMMIKMIQKKPPEQQTEEDKGILQSQGKRVDFSDPEAIAPLIKCAQG